ncbi:SWI/SNF-related matrix-associated actin-dependent regulator of chromatin subfamily A-like protein 1 [Armadillidium nasatum]|uniref:SWI/SNF-related matrix-associated actin-dependent regulator of chromatin subfamily A-like protein 1 n=1 Tax=Armadillidium nasatum TaxID=96803 RepID=A0A5N5T6V2_9CRUS|nr:SWI/SNF-related matrix-associated actin-dependent regulator of chromatin subfamily A-like protein 1 [Armadillidium nasatum]
MQHSRYDTMKDCFIEPIPTTPKDISSLNFCLKSIDLDQDLREDQRFHLSEYVKELLTEGNKKFLVFAHHRIMLNSISETCEEQKVHYIRIDGSTNSESRQKLVDHFQTDPNTRVAVLSITAASSGITLTAAQLVVFAELYWNPGLLIQAEDRAHRIGQVDSVLVQYLVAKGTADDFIWPLVQSKLNILNKVGLSKDSFSGAASTKQKANNKEGIMKYFSEIKDEEFLNDLFDDIPESSSSSQSSPSPSVKRKKLSENEED